MENIIDDTNSFFYSRLRRLVGDAQTANEIYDLVEEHIECISRYKKDLEDKNKRCICLAWGWKD